MHFLQLLVVLHWKLLLLVALKTDRVGKSWTRKKATTHATGTSKQTQKKRSWWRELEHGILLIVGRPVIITER